MTKKELYLDLTNKTLKDIEGVTQVWIDSELERLTGISKTTWTSNYKMNTQLKKGVMMQLKINELTNENKEMRDIFKMIMSGDYTCGDIICDIEDFLNRKEK